MFWRISNSDGQWIWRNRTANGNRYVYSARWNPCIYCFRRQWLPWNNYSDHYATCGALISHHDADGHTMPWQYDRCGYINGQWRHTGLYLLMDGRCDHSNHHGPYPWHLQLYGNRYAQLQHNRQRYDHG